MSCPRCKMPDHLNKGNEECRGCGDSLVTVESLKAQLADAVQNEVRLLELLHKLESQLKSTVKDLNFYGGERARYAIQARKDFLKELQKEKLEKSK